MRSFFQRSFITLTSSAVFVMFGGYVLKIVAQLKGCIKSRDLCAARPIYGNRRSPSCELRIEQFAPRKIDKSDANLVPRFRRPIADSISAQMPTEVRIADEE